MTRYKIAQIKESGVAEVKLEQSGGDIDISINGIMVAWFDEDGTLCLVELDDSEAEELEGVGIGITNSYIKTGRF